MDNTMLWDNSSSNEVIPSEILIPSGQDQNDGVTELDNGDVMMSARARDMLNQQWDAREEDLKNCRLEIASLRHIVAQCKKEYFETVSSHEDTISILKQRLALSQTDNIRLVLQNEDLRGNIRVMCRIRPSEAKRKESAVFKWQSQMAVSFKEQLYNFFHVFSTKETNDDVFSQVQTLVDLLFKGRNLSIAAYGQTGSGKTFTMTAIGSKAIDYMFALRHKHEASQRMQFDCTAVEVYMNKAYNLMTPEPISIKLKTDAESFWDPDVTATPIYSTVQAQEFFARAIAKRSIKGTVSNATSSRSHFIFTISLKTWHEDDASGVTTTYINFIDFAGSEKPTENAKEQQDEGIQINLDLSHLGRLISALNSNTANVSLFRERELSKILRRSLSGDSKFVFIFTLNAEEAREKETLATIEFAQRTQEICLPTTQGKTSRGRRQPQPPQPIISPSPSRNISSPSMNIGERSRSRAVSSTASSPRMAPFRLS